MIAVETRMGRKRWWRRGMWWLGLAILLGLLAIALEHLRGRWTVAAHLRALREAGESLDPGALVPPAVDPGQNAALFTLAHTNEFKALEHYLEAMPALMVLVTNGQAKVAWRQSSWTSVDQKPLDWDELNQRWAPHREFIAELERELAKTGFDSGFDYRRGFLNFQSPPLLQLRRATQVFTARALADLRAGNLAEAHTELLRVLRWLALQHTERLIIAQLVRASSAQLAFQLTWEACQAEGWSDAQLAAWQAAWEQCRLAEDMGACLVMERAMTWQTFEALRRSSAQRRSAFEEKEQVEEMGEEFAELNAPLPGRGFWLHHGLVPLWRVAWIDQDLRRALDQWQVLIAADRQARQGSWPTARDDLARAEDRWQTDATFNGLTGRYRRCRWLYSGKGLGVGGTLILRSLRQTTQQQMALTAIALQRYHLRHGDYPPKLEALVPELLARLPQDAFNPQPLRYQRLTQRAYTLYSVGDDGRDDGGDAGLKTGQDRYGTIWDGRDAVWPQPLEPTVPAPRQE